MCGSRLLFVVAIDIHQVKPQVGSIKGGTLLTITGSGFGFKENEVDVDGIPCQVCIYEFYNEYNDSIFFCQGRGLETRLWYSANMCYQKINVCVYFT